MLAADKALIMTTQRTEVYRSLLIISLVVRDVPLGRAHCLLEKIIMRQHVPIVQLINVQEKGETGMFFP